MTNEFKGLRHYIDIVEAKEQSVDEAGIMNALGQLGGAVGGTVANGVNAVGNAVGGAYDAAKQGVTGAVDAAGKAIAGAVDPLVQGAKQGYANATGTPAPTQTAAKPQAGQSASPKPAAKPAAKSDPAVLKLQQDLIAKGAKIKADGIMGPATQAAQKQFGGQAASPAPAAAPVATGPGNAPAPAATNAASLKAAQDQAAGNAPAATNATADTTQGPANLGTAGTQATAGGYAPAATTPDNSNVASDDIPFDPTWGGTVAPKDTRSTAEKILPNFLGGKAAPTAANKNATWNNAQQAAVSNKPAAVGESAGYDELQRIVSLVHHR